MAWTRADGTFTGTPRQAVVYEGHHDGRLDRRVWRGPTSDTQDPTVEVRGLAVPSGCVRGQDIFIIVRLMELFKTWA